MEAPSLGEWSHARQRNHDNRHRYPPELRERAVRMVFETIEQTGERNGAVTRVARNLGIGVESLRQWVRQAEIDKGSEPASRPKSAAASSSSNARTANFAAPTRS